MERRAVGYVRVSTEEQATEGYSLDAQEMANRAFAQAKGWTYVRTYRDEGVSAYNELERRPGYDGMMSEIDSWDVLIVWRLNRLHRRLKRLLADADTLHEHGKDLASLGESIDTSSAIGRFLFSLFGALNELESGQTSERIRLALGHKFRTEKNVYFGGKGILSPLGYRWDRERQILVIDEAEAMVIRELFELVAAGMSRARVVSEMTSKSALRRQSSRWDGFYINKVVRNAIYAGYAHFDGKLRRMDHEAIIPIELFNEAQMAMFAGRYQREGVWPLILGEDEVDVTEVRSGRWNKLLYYRGTEAPKDLARRMKHAKANRQKAKRGRDD